MQVYSRWISYYLVLTLSEMKIILIYMLQDALLVTEAGSYYFFLGRISK